MTTAELAGTREGGASQLSVGEILNLCDRILGELGRRRHMFTWLRAPGAQVEEWLTVDGYYPANRLVVVWHERAEASDELFEQLIPAHGLRLLELTPGDVGSDAEAAELALRRLLTTLGPSPKRARETQMRTVPASSPAPAAAARSNESVGLGVLEGLALAAVLILEMYLGVVHGALDAGRPVLAFGLALDASSRPLGTIAASRAGSPLWAWLCALGGSPFVAGFVLPRRDGPLAVEPAPLAGLMAMLALGAIALAVLTGS